MQMKSIAGVLTAAGLAALTAGCGGVAKVALERQINTTPHCTDFFFPVYFAGASAELTKPALAVINDAVRHGKGCAISDVRVLGLADYHGSVSPNLELSRRRARTVEAAMIQAGLPAPSFRLSAVGQDDAIADQSETKPLRRRVNVFIRYQH